MSKAHGAGGEDTWWEMAACGGGGFADVMECFFPKLSKNTGVFEVVPGRSEVTTLPESYSCFFFHCR